MSPTAGSIFMVYSGPILVIAFLSIAYLIISGEEELHEYVFVKCGVLVSMISGFEI